MFLLFTYEIAETQFDFSLENEEDSTIHASQYYTSSELELNSMREHDSILEINLLPANADAPNQTLQLNQKPTKERVNPILEKLQETFKSRTSLTTAKQSITLAIKKNRCVPFLKGATDFNPGLNGSTARMQGLREQFRDIIRENNNSLQHHFAEFLEGEIGNETETIKCLRDEALAIAGKDEETLNMLKHGLQKFIKDEQTLVQRHRDYEEDREKREHRNQQRKRPRDYSTSDYRIPKLPKRH